MITNKNLEEISLENKTQKISFDAITDAESDATPARHASFLFFSHNFSPIISKEKWSVHSPVEEKIYYPFDP